MLSVKCRWSQPDLSDRLLRSRVSVLTLSVLTSSSQGGGGAQADLRGKVSWDRRALQAPAYARSKSYTTGLNKTLVLLLQSQDPLSQSSGLYKGHVSLRVKELVTHCFGDNLFLGLPNLERNPVRETKRDEEGG